MSSWEILESERGFDPHFIRYLAFIGKDSSSQSSNYTSLFYKKVVIWRVIHWRVHREGQSGNVLFLDESEDHLSSIKLTCQGVVDDIDENIDILIKPSESQSVNLADKAKDVARYAVEKMKKNCVAAGEDGQFKNWVRTFS